MTVGESNHEPAPPPAAPSPHATRSHTLIAWLALTLAVVIAAVGTSPFWAPALAPVLPWGRQKLADRSGPALDISRLQARLDADDTAVREQAARLSQLETDVAALKQQAGRISQLGDIEAGLKDQAARLAQLEARPAPTTTATPPATPAQSPETAAAIKALQDQTARLSAGTEATGAQIAKLQAELQKAIAANAAHRASLLALANLRVAVEGSAPFVAELAAAEALAGDTAAKSALASLDADAKAGLPTLAALSERFDRGVAPAILRAPRGETRANWWQEIRMRVERLVVIRRIAPGGPAPRDATEAAVTKADAALGAGDLAAAAAALRDLSGDAAKAAAPWLAQAERRVAAETTLAKLWQDEVAQSGDKP